MRSTRNRGTIAAIVAIILLALPLAPVSAAPLDSRSAARAEESFVAQLWQWLASLFGTETAGGGDATTASTCLSTTTGRGCAIDPNGGGSY